MARHDGAQPLGKAQRLLAGVDPSIGPIACHGAVEKMNQAYRAEGVALPATIHVAATSETDWRRFLIVAPPSADGSPWLRRFTAKSRGFASGWMRIRGTRRRRTVDRGFVLSDHADWPGLLAAARSWRSKAPADETFRLALGGVGGVGIMLVQLFGPKASDPLTLATAALGLGGCLLADLFLFAANNTPPGAMHRAGYYASVALFVPAVLALHALGLSTPMTRAAVVVYFFARLAHYLVYAAGIPSARTLAFTVGFLARIKPAMLGLAEPRFATLAEVHHHEVSPALPCSVGIAVEPDAHTFSPGSSA